MGHAVDEDDPPVNPDDVNPGLFDYFGFGQPSPAPFAPPPNPNVGPDADGWPHQNPDIPQ